MAWYENYNSENRDNLISCEDNRMKADCRRPSSIIRQIVMKREFKLSGTMLLSIVSRDLCPAQSVYTVHLIKRNDE